MPLPELLGEAGRQMTICNACRYCEGYCAVFPAMELRRDFSHADLGYLANLCFDCRACYHACPFTAPHEFEVNLPRIFAEVRGETYRRYAWPRIRSGSPGQYELLVPMLAGACMLIVPLLILAVQGSSVLFSSHLGAGAFFRIVPYSVIVLPALALLLYGLGSLTVGALRFWRDTGGRLSQLLDPRALLHATRDALGLEYLKGGGAGCSYPDARFSHARRWLHHLVFYGFGVALAATTTAAIYRHLFGWVSPYPLGSLPVVLGTSGGIAMSAGSLGLLWLKWRSDPEPSDPRMVRMDVGFLLLLLATNLTGLLLLAVRETAAMGILLAVHLGAIAGLFLTLPYGKLAHVAYRYAALVRNSIEQSRQSPLPELPLLPTGTAGATPRSPLE